MKKLTIFILTTIFLQGTAFAAAPKGITSLFQKVEEAKDKKENPTKEEILKYLAEETKKLDKMDLLSISNYLYKAGEHLDKKFDEAFLTTLLSYYPEILKKEMSHTLVEMFADSYKKNQSRFDDIIDKQLNAEQREDFRGRIQAAFHEQEHGQG